MFDFIREYQLDIMLFLCGICAAVIFLLMITRFLSSGRRRALLITELTAFFLLWFDRMAYIYGGNQSLTGYIMVRLSSFMLFFLTAGMIFGFNLYLSDYLMDEGGLSALPLRLKVVRYIAIGGMLLAVVFSLTGLYYYVDGANQYHRGQGFIIAYFIPVVCVIIQYSVIWQNRKVFSRLIYTSLTLFIFVPFACGIVQAFIYGISILNMALVLVSICLYIFTYLDINNTVEHAHRLEMEGLHKEQESMKRLFDQAATAFITAVEKRDEFSQGHSVRVAEYARKIAENSGKNEEECSQVYYAGLLHDVGMIGLSDEAIQKGQDPEKGDNETIRQIPVVGREILSSITEYPYLSTGAYYSHERYDGKGYPEGLKKEEIPEIARIVAAADKYVSMITRKRYRDARPGFLAREALIRKAGTELDPGFAHALVKIIDRDGFGDEQEKTLTVERELDCSEYRDSMSCGIPVEEKITRIRFRCEKMDCGSDEFSAPSIILFDSYDRRVHRDRKDIEELSYYEHGEIWFNNHSVATFAREIREYPLPPSERTEGKNYEIRMGRYRDHIKLVMRSPDNAREVVVALPNSSDSVYVALTGEHCRLRNIQVLQTGEIIGEKDIPRIAKEISHTDGMEGDLKNIQIDHPLSAYTSAIEIRDRLKLIFHTTTLPGSTLIWHCPYIVLYYSQDKTVGGAGYREYAMIKLDGEDNGSNAYARNNCNVTHTSAFPGWEAWKEANREGMECRITLEKRGNRVTLSTENLGIRIQNVTELSDRTGTVYAALTGDKCALTDIRVQ